MYPIIPLLLVAFPSTIFGLPTHSPLLTGSDLHASHSHPRAVTDSLVDVTDTYPELDNLLLGNAQFRKGIADSDPALLDQLSKEGQHPDFMFLGCSDSRVSEGTIFSARPGTLFTERNIANQYSPADPNDVSILSYAVAELSVGHIIVMGHYGCGGVGASILERPSGVLDHARESIQNWISPIRRLYQSSTRAEIIDMRMKRATDGHQPPAITDPGFRALVEENVKASVIAIATDPAMLDHWSAYLSESIRSKENPLKPVYIHGFVYDISDGQIYDLNITHGPTGYVELSTPTVAAVKSAMPLLPVADH